jgi:hypothetical protein
LRDALRAIRAGAAERLFFDPPAVEEQAAFFAEASVIPESDLGRYLDERVARLEARAHGLADGPLSRARRVLRRART